HVESSVLSGSSAIRTLAANVRIARDSPQVLTDFCTGRDPQGECSIAVPKTPERLCQIQRAAAAPLSSGRVLKAMAARGAARWMALTTASNRTKRLGGRRTPAPITTQS